MSLWGDRNIKRFVRAVYLAFLSIAIGIAGYMIIENYSVGDAFYMTVITISTVGFSELSDLSFTGRMFTAFYIIFNVGLVAYIVSIISRYLFEGELRDVFTNYISKREVDKLSDHVIICGYGRNGYTAHEELKKSNLEVVVIDDNKDLIEQRLDQNEGLLIIKGDATDDNILKSAGVERARALIVAIPNDASNVFITLTARELNPRIKIICRASMENSERRLIKAGADNVVKPNAVGGHYMASLVNRPQVVEFLDMLNGIGQIKLELEDVAYQDLKDEFKGKSIAELRVRQHADVTFIGKRDHKKEYMFNPTGQTVLNSQDVLIVLGTPAEIEKFKEVFLTRK